jgi:hypothetical protein
VFLPQHSPPPPPRQPARRSRSLERTSNFRVYPVTSPPAPPPSTDGSRSLERNHKFRISHAVIASTPNLECGGRHAFPHCESCPLAAHNKVCLFYIFSMKNTLIIIYKVNYKYFKAYFYYFVICM